VSEHHAHFHRVPAIFRAFVVYSFRVYKSRFR
jgi:hypothetical protein